MSNKLILITTALAPMIWGSSYLVTTEYLPQGYPLTLAALRALPVGVILLLLCRPKKYCCPVLPVRTPGRPGLRHPEAQQRADGRRIQAGPESSEYAFRG